MLIRKIEKEKKGIKRTRKRWLIDRAMRKGDGQKEHRSRVT